MEINLESPYSRDWVKGYLVTNSEPRRTVILYNQSNQRSSVSYARYLMSVHLKRYLTRDEIVDHVNNNPMDDCISNYQLLSSSENIKKGLKALNKSQLFCDFICGSCGAPFSKVRKQTHLAKAGKVKSTYCSKICAGRHLKPSTLVREYRS